MARQMAFLRAALLPHRARIRHPEPERAIDLAIFFAASVARERLLFADSTHAAATGMETEELQRELQRLLRGYLRIGDPKP